MSESDEPTGPVRTVSRHSQRTAENQSEYVAVPRDLWSQILTELRRKERVAHASEGEMDGDGRAPISCT